MVDLLTVKPRKGPARLMPATQLDLEQLDGVRADQPVETRVVFRRSLPHHRWFMALIGVVADGCGLAPGTLRAQLKFEAGLVSRILTSPAFGVAVELKSQKFSQMDETEFTAFRRLAVDILFKRYLPGVKRRDVYAKVEELLGEPCPW